MRSNFDSEKKLFALFSDTGICTVYYVYFATQPDRLPLYGQLVAVAGVERFQKRFICKNMMIARRSLFGSASCRSDLLFRLLSRRMRV